MTFQLPEILLFDRREWAMYSYPLSHFGTPPSSGNADRTIPWAIVKPDVGWLYPGGTALQRGYQGRWLIDQHDRLLLSHVEARITPISPAPDVIGWGDRQSPWIMRGYFVPEDAMPIAPLSDLVGMVPQPIEPLRLTPRWAPRHTYLVDGGRILIACSPHAFAAVAAGGTVSAVVTDNGVTQAFDFDPTGATRIDPSEAVFTGDLCGTAVRVESATRWRRSRLERGGAPLARENMVVFVCVGDPHSPRDHRPMTAFDTSGERWAEVDDFTFDGFPVFADWFSGELRLSQDDPIHTSSGGAYELRTETLLIVRDGVIASR